MNLVCGQLQSQDQEASISAAIVLSLAAVQGKGFFFCLFFLFIFFVYFFFFVLIILLLFLGNNEVGKSILNSQTVHAFLGQLPIAADYQLVNLLKGTSALVSEGFFFLPPFFFSNFFSFFLALISLLPFHLVQFGHAAMMQGVGDAIAAVLKRKIPLFCSTAFRILLTLGTSRLLFFLLYLL